MTRLQLNSLGKPIKPLPKNAFRARSIQAVMSLNQMETGTFGVFMTRRTPGELRLMRWGYNCTREDVKQNPHLLYVWIGTVTELDTLQSRDNFAPCL